MIHEFAAAHPGISVYLVEHYLDHLLRDFLPYTTSPRVRLDGYVGDVFMVPVRFDYVLTHAALLEQVPFFRGADLNSWAKGAGNVLVPGYAEPEVRACLGAAFAVFLPTLLNAGVHYRYTNLTRSGRTDTHLHLYLSELTPHVRRFMHAHAIAESDVVRAAALSSKQYMFDRQGRGVFHSLLQDPLGAGEDVPRLNENGTLTDLPPFIVRILRHYKLLALGGEGVLQKNIPTY